MAARKAAPPPEPVLENFYDVKAATVRLGLATEDPDDKSGQKWLRDGVNVEGWPCHRLAGKLMFSDSDLADIAERRRNAPERRGHYPRRRTRKPSAPDSPEQSVA